MSDATECKVTHDTGPSHEEEGEVDERLRVLLRRVLEDVEDVLVARDWVNRLRFSTLSARAIELGRTVQRDGLGTTLLHRR